MSCKVLATLTLNGFEKLICADGGWETICHTAHLTGNYRKIIDNALSAVECLLKRHSRMRSRIRIETNGYFLDTLEYDREYMPGNLFFSAIDSDHATWEKIAEFQCNQDPYSNDGTIIFPLFHFILLFNSKLRRNDEQFHLLLFHNHSASDGRSGFILINDFLNLVTSSNIDGNSEPDDPTILPLVSDLIPRPLGPLYPVIFFIAKRVFKYEFRKLNRPRIPIKLSPLSNSQPSRFQAPRYYTKFLFSSSSKELYSNLYKQCKQNQVTINGPLVACLLLTIHHLFPLKKNTRLKPCSIGIPFDMRSRLPRSPLTNNSVGAFIGTSEIKIHRSMSMYSARFWSLAKKCIKKTQKQLNSFGVPLIMNCFVDINRQDGNFTRITRYFPDGRLSEIALSNVGKYPFPCEYNQKELVLHGLHSINSNSVYRTSSMVFVSCAGDGQLDFSLSHEMESDQKAKQFLDFYIGLLEKCADDKICSQQITLNELLQSSNS